MIRFWSVFSVFSIFSIFYCFCIKVKGDLVIVNLIEVKVNFYLRKIVEECGIVVSDIICC